MKIWAGGIANAFKASTGRWDIAAGVGFHFDDFSGLPVVCGPVEGMEEEPSVSGGGEYGVDGERGEEGRRERASEREKERALSTDLAA